MKISKEQVSALSKEEKLRLLDVIKEKKRRSLLAKPKFSPHPGQRRVIESKALERYLFSGNAFGKTTVLVNELHWAMTGYNAITGEHTRVPAKAVLVIATPEQIDDVITEYRKWYPLEDRHLHKRGKAHYSEITYDNGSTVSVLTHEVSDLKPEGAENTHIFANEPPPQWLFQAIFRGGRIKGRPMKVLMAGTPIKAAWLRTEVYEPWLKGKTPWVECFTGDSEENASNLEEGWLERFSAKLSDKEKKIRLQGQFFDLEGLALSHLFRQDTHVIDEEAFPHRPERPCVLVFDPHPSKAHNAVVLACDEDNNFYVAAEYKSKAVAREFVQQIVQLGWLNKFRLIDIVYDSLGSSDSTSGEGFRSFGDVVNEELKKYGKRARATTFADKNDEDFIERIRDVLVVPPGDNSVPRLRFYSHCRGCIEDVRTVGWYEDKQLKENKPKLDIRQKDFLSCIKYALATNLFYTKPKKQQPHYRTRPAYGIGLPAQTQARNAAIGSIARPRRFFKGLRRRPNALRDGDDD